MTAATNWLPTPVTTCYNRDEQNRRRHGGEKGDDVMNLGKISFTLDFQLVAQVRDDTQEERTRL